MVHSILVAIDGSAGSRKAATFARDLAGQTGARLVLLVAITPPSTTPLPPFDSFSMTRPSPDPEHLAAARALMDEIEASLPQGQATAQVALGPDPADTICQEAAKADVDLVVVGARGLGAAGRLLVGSVSEKVVREAGRPVLVVH